MTDNKKRKVRSLKAVKAKYLESHPKIREWIEFTIDDCDPDLLSLAMLGVPAAYAQSARLIGDAEWDSDSAKAVLAALAAGQ